MAYCTLGMQVINVKLVLDGVLPHKQVQACKDTHGVGTMENQIDRNLGTTFQQALILLA